MPTSASARYVTRLGAAAGIAAAVALSAIARIDAQQDLQFIISFADAAGMPLGDIAPEELAILENGVRGTILQMEQVGRPLDVTLLVDNGVGMGTALAELRTAARGFFQALPDGTQMSLLTIAPQPRWLQRPTTNQRDAVRAVDRMTPDDSTGRFLDALVEFGDRLDRQSEGRQAIVVAVGSSAPDGSTSQQRHFRQLAQRLSDSGAIVHAAIVTSTARLTGGRLPEGGVSSDLQRVVGLELSRSTGGRYEQLAVTSRLVTLLPELAAQIVGSSRPYRVRARRPEAAKGDIGSIAFAIGRQGVTIRPPFVGGSAPAPAPAR
jgi:hypothetical protein